MEYTHPAIRRGYLRQLWAFLRAHPLVERVKVKAFKARIYFRTGIAETWHKNKILEARILIPYNPFVGKKLILEQQYEHEILDSPILAKMHIIRHKDWKRGTFVSRRLVIQEYLRDLLTEGYFRIEFPRQELLDDLKRLSSADIWHRHTRKGSFILQYGRGTPGRKLIEQFSEWGEAGEESIKAKWSAKPLYLAIRRILLGRSDVTRHSIMCRISKMSRCRFITPNFYRLILQKLQLINQVVADPYPGFGSKAIACTLDNHNYHSNGDFSQLETFLGTSFENLDRDYYDVVFLDYGFIDPGEQLIPDLKFWSRKADTKIVFVPDRLLNILPKPTYIMKICVCVDRYRTIYIYQ